MPTTSWIPLVNTIKNNSQVSAEVVNPVFAQLAQREQHLYERFDELTDKATLVAVNVQSAEVLTEGVPVYYGTTGLKRAKIGYKNTTLTTAYFDPTDTSFVFGLVKSYNASLAKADVFVSGSVTLTVTIQSLLQSGDTFRVGPLYLSRETGKLTNSPDGLAVFVGHATGEYTLLLNPKVNELSKVLTQYTSVLLDRVAGAPSWTGTAWIINSPESNSVGWIPAVGGPAGAKFKYNLPVALFSTQDTGLTTAENDEALELLSNFPPTPATYNQLYLNGVLQPQQVGSYSADGIYIVNSDGIWWLKDGLTEVPWASTIASTTGGYASGADWVDYKGTVAIQADRKKLYLSFVKAHPDFKRLTVTSLSAADGTANAIRIINNDATDDTSGDLQLKLQLINNETTGSGAGVAVSSVQYNQETGRLDVTTTPNVSAIRSTGNIAISTDSETGVVTLGPQADVSGQILSLEPRNGATLEYVGLNSFLRFKHNANHGVIGKFQLPQIIPTTGLQIQLYMCGESNISAATTTKWRFEYAVNAPTSLLPNPNTNNISDTLGTSSTSTDVVQTFETKTSYQTFIYPTSDSVFVIPATALCGGAMVNFKLTRYTALTPGTYENNLAIVGIFWKFIA